jgi:hypothetical protein
VCLPWRAGKSGTRERNAKVAGLVSRNSGRVTELLENPDVNEGCAHGPLRSARGSRPGVRVRRVGRHVEA